MLRVCVNTKVFYTFLLLLYSIIVVILVGKLSDMKLLTLSNKLLPLYNNEAKQEQCNGVKLFCVVPTLPENIITKGRTIYETWAKKCDGLKFVLKLPSNLTAAIANFADFNYKPNGFIDFNNILEPANFSGDIKPNPYQLSRKIFDAFAYVYQKYDRYDWYLKADDDSFIFVDNLKTFLADKRPNEPITYGYNFVAFVQDGYHSGGAGYVISNEAMKRVGKQLNENKEFCKVSGAEDVDMALCLRNLGVKIGNSTDDFGRERFHPGTINMHYNGKFPKWLETYAQNKPKTVKILLIKDLIF